MAYRTLVECDQCGKKTDKPSSVWLDVYLGQTTIKFMAWSKSNAGDSTYLQACGAECAHKLLDSWLNKRRD